MLITLRLAFSVVPIRDTCSWSDSPSNSPEKVYYHGLVVALRCLCPRPSSPLSALYFQLKLRGSGSFSLKSWESTRLPAYISWHSRCAAQCSPNFQGTLSRSSAVSHRYTQCLLRASVLRAGFSQSPTVPKLLNWNC